MAQMARSPARRFVAAAVLALAVFATLGGAAIAANTTSAEPGLPPYVDVPEPMIGDRGAYDIWHSGKLTEREPDRYNPTPRRAFEFAWTNGPPMANRTDHIVATERIELSTFAMVDVDGTSELKATEDTVWFQRGSSHIMALTWGYRSDWNFTTTPIPAPLVNMSLKWGWAFDVLAYPQDPPLQWEHCLLSYSSMGTRIPTNRSVAFSQRCMDPQEPWPPFWGPNRYQATATETVAGIQTVRFEDVESLKNPERAFARHVWLAPGIPYPVKIWTRYHVSSELESGPLERTLQLVGLERGLVPRGPAEVLRGPVDLVQTERMEWGMDDSDVTHPFPLSEAFARAKTEGGFDDLRDFLKAHPNAYTASAHYTEEERDQTLQRIWAIVVSDGTESLHLRVHETEDIHHPALPEAVLELNRRHSFTSEKKESADGSRLDYPRIETLPPTLPTAASIMARAGDYLQGSDLNSWGFDTWCKEDDCATALVSVSAGIRFVRDNQLVHREPTLLPLVDINKTAVSFYMNADQDGNVNAIVMGQSTESHSTEVTSVAMMPAGVDQDVKGSLPSPQSRMAWIEPQQAAGAGLAALLAGILYWLWPALKGGLLGLFSRLREPELLESPQRRRIMDLVEAQPGIHFKELLRQSGIPNGSLVHHVGQLQKAGLLVAKPSNGYTCYFPRGPADAERAAILKADGARQVLAAVQASPGLSGLEVAHLTGLQPSTVNYHAKRLADAGLLSPVRDGRAVRLHPRTDASAAKT